VALLICGTVKMTYCGKLFSSAAMKALKKWDCGHTLQGGSRERSCPSPVFGSADHLWKIAKI